MGCQMNRRYCRLLFLLVFITTSVVPSSQAAAWSGIINSPRATDWTTAGIPGGIPSGSWKQCGSTIAAYGSSGSYASPSTIQSAINACGTNQFVLLGPGDFYLSGEVNLKSNMVLRGSGANQTRIHVSGSNVGCAGSGGVVCIDGGLAYGGSCITGGTNWWSCANGTFSPGYPQTANWTGGYTQGSPTITLDNVSGIVANVTPIVLDQCDTGMSGSINEEGCAGPSGAVTSASIYSGGGGTGYNVGDTGTIGCSLNFGRCYGSGTATYQVTSVSGGTVTGFTITSGGGGYTYSSSNSYVTNYGGLPYVATTATSGNGSGLELQITGVTGYDNGGFFISGIDMIGADQSDSGTSRPGRSQSEVVVATSIRGNTLTLSHPIMNPNWNTNQSPQAWWGNSTITNAGVEDLMLDVSALSTSAVSMNNATNVWVKGITSSTANYLHVIPFVASNVEVRDSYFYWTKNSGTESYGIGSAGDVGNALFENNIQQGIVDPLSAAGDCNGCVYAYNFSVNQYDSLAPLFLFTSSNMHAAGSNYILEEGNIGSGAAQDTIHGPHLANTFFRNYWNGYETNNGTLPLYNTIPVVIGGYSRYNNYLANVLGTAGYHTYYQCNPATSLQQYCAAYGGSYPGYTHIWDIGWSHSVQLDYNNTPPLPNDLLTASSLYRYGNYDTVSGAVQTNSSEVPTSDPNFPNVVPSGTFPASFYNGVAGVYPNCGTGLSYWKNPSTGVCPPYPGIGPDVKNGDIGMCTSGTYKWSRALNANQCAGGTFAASVNGGYGYSNPAMRCYLNQMAGTPDGTGSLLSFNRTACYANDPAGSGSGNVAPVITSAGSATGVVETAFSYQITATNNPTSYGSFGLPTGLTVDTTSGLISGTPTDNGISTSTIFAINSLGTGSATLTITIGGTGNTGSAPTYSPSVYPNPWRSDKHAGRNITFNGLTTGTDIKIFTVSGRKVAELHTDGPSVQWDLSNDSGDKVASGIYLYVLTDGQGDKARGKVAIIR